MRKQIWLTPVSALSLMGPAMAGPPYLTDDPQPTPYSHYEIYSFGQGTKTVDGTTGAAGTDFNYGGAPDLQLTANIAAGFSAPSIGRSSAGFANTQLAAKYRFLHADTFGWDVAIFPRVFLPSSERTFGSTNTSVLIPIWVQKDLGGGLTLFGGGGCQFFAGDAAQNFCETGWVTTFELTKGLTLGGEVFHQTASAATPAQTSLGAASRSTLTTPTICSATSTAGSRTGPRPTRSPGTLRCCSHFEPWRAVLGPGSARQAP